ncbi:MAG TPA: flagellar biosynthetic protein FliO [Rhabdochlamydiaceae bacterium]
MASLAYGQAPASSQEQQQPTLPSTEMPPLPSSEELTQSYEGSFVRIIVSLLGLIVLIVATFWILKRLGRGRFGKLGGDRAIRIVEKRPLSPKSVLYIVEMGSKRVLISESQVEVRALSSVELAQEENS